MTDCALALKPSISGCGIVDWDVLMCKDGMTPDNFTVEEIRCRLRIDASGPSLHLI